MFVGNVCERRISQRLYELLGGDVVFSIGNNRTSEQRKALRLLRTTVEEAERKCLGSEGDLKSRVTCSIWR